MYNYRVADNLGITLGGFVVPPVFDKPFTDLRGIGEAVDPYAVGQRGKLGISRSEWIVGTHFLVPVESSRETAPPPFPSEHVQHLLACLASGHYSGQERRRHKRHAVTVPVVALPLAADYRIDGESVHMTATNVSLGGAALMYTSSIAAPYLVLDFGAAGEELLQVVLQILRLRSIGSLFEICGQFIGRLPQVPE
jgi:hypothetical protein